jgi:hypothetical protein
MKTPIRLTDRDHLYMVPDAFALRHAEVERRFFQPTLEELLGEEDRESEKSH